VPIVELNEEWNLKNSPTILISSDARRGSEFDLLPAWIKLLRIWFILRVSSKNIEIDCISLNQISCSKGCGEGVYSR